MAAIDTFHLYMCVESVLEIVANCIHHYYTGTIERGYTNTPACWIAELAELLLLSLCEVNFTAAATAAATALNKPLN